jgi:hypothetical protein
MKLPSVSEEFKGLSLGHFKYLLTYLLANCLGDVTRAITGHDMASHSLITIRIDRLRMSHWRNLYVNNTRETKQLGWYLAVLINLATK